MSANFINHLPNIYIGIDSWPGTVSRFDQRRSDAARISRWLQLNCHDERTENREHEQFRESVSGEEELLSPVRNGIIDFNEVHWLWRVPIVRLCSFGDWQADRFGNFGIPTKQNQWTAANGAWPTNFFDWLFFLPGVNSVAHFLLFCQTWQSYRCWTFLRISWQAIFIQS